jgi:hypothetical protein
MGNRGTPKRSWAGGGGVGFRFYLVSTLRNVENFVQLRQPSSILHNKDYTKLELDRFVGLLPQLRQLRPPSPPRS